MLYLHPCAGKAQLGVTTKTTTNTLIINLFISMFKKIQSALLAVVLVFAGMNLSAQNRTVTGVVTDNLGPVIGAGVVVAGTNNGAVTLPDGSFTLNDVPMGATLQVSCIGYKTVELVFDGKPVNVVLEEDNQLLEGVVVTALGIEKKAKSLTYATQKVDSEELTRVKEVNMVNSLQGKTAGLVITPTQSGSGGSSSILLRGNKSANGNNQPLIVIDGMPMNNHTNGQTTSFYGGFDQGDALSNLNSEDVQSISVLKGASAAALYGSQAANGVILITTKSGTKGKVRVDFSSNFAAEQAAYGNAIQTTYGAEELGGGALDTYSWGTSKLSKAPGANRIKDFYRTGWTWTNAVDISGGSDHLQTYASYANTKSNGITPGNDYMRHNMMLKNTYKLIDDRLTITTSINYINQKLNNNPRQGQYNNALTGLYTFPNNGDWAYYKENFEYYDENTMQYAQKWYRDVNNDFSANPYWVIYRNPNVSNRNRIMATASVKFNITDWLSIQGRINYDRSMNDWEQKEYAGTAGVLANAKGDYEVTKWDTRQMYGDLMMNFNKSFGDVSVQGAIGTSFTDYKHTSLGVSLAGDRFLPNYWSLANGAKNGASNGMTRRRLNAVFATAQIGWKDMIFLDLTARNDWSSTLAFTPNISYFYPSVGLTVILSDLFKMPEAVNLLKARASYSIVGNEMPTYITNPTNGFSNGSVSFNTSVPFTDMQPEKLHSLEAGFDLAMFDNRLAMDVTYYKTNNMNQYFSMSVPSATGYSSYYFNAGNIQNQGVEFSISWNQRFNRDFSWKTGFNAAFNANKIVALDNRVGVDDADRLTKVNIGGNYAYDINLVEGGSFGDIYGKKVAYKDGLPVIDANGKVVLETDANGDKVLLGNVNAPWTLGWNNTFTFKEWQLYVLVDGKIGGKYMDMTQASMSQYGTSLETGIARDNGGVKVYNQATGSTTTMTAQDFYTQIGSKDAGSDWFIYDQTNIRLRELSLGYMFRDVFGNGKNITVSAIGRNLFFIFRHCPSDPDSSMSTESGYAGMTFYGLPTTRSFGLNVKLSF